VTIEGTGKEARGAGTASATVQARLHDEGAQTRVTVHTTLNVTGRPAQFGRGILSEVGGKLVKRFADNLAEELAREETGAAASDDAGGTGGPAETGAGGSPVTPPAVAATAAPVTEPTTEPAEAGAPAATGDGSSGATPTAETASATTGGTETPAEQGEGTGTPAEQGEGTGDHAEAATEGKRPAAPPAGAGSAPERAAAERRQQPAAEAIDLLEVAGPSIAKRVGPVLAGLAVLWTIWRLFRRK
jgi:hypothetical protein